MSRQINHDEVKKHADEKSTWTIIHHDVYDVTKFLNEHPGGADSLLEYAGKDGTQAFEDVAHSEDAREMMKKYKIGTIPENERGGQGTQCGFVPYLNREFIVLPAAREVGSGSDGGSGLSLHGPAIGPCGYCQEPTTRVPRKPRPEPVTVKPIIAPRESGFVPHYKEIIVLPSKNCCSPEKLAKKTWRSYDGSPLRQGVSGGSSSPSRQPCDCGIVKIKAETKKPEPPVKAIVVPKDRRAPRRPRPPPPPAGGSSTLKWALIALAGAVIIGIAVKKYSG